MIKNNLKKYRFTLIGVFVGALGGYAYWYFIGCNSGNCPITSSPLYSSIWGAVLGTLVLSTFDEKNKNENENKNE